MKNDAGNHQGHGQREGQQSPAGRSSRGKIAFGLFLLIALFFLLTEHRAHFLGFLPYLLLLACPLLHVFHHGGHGRHGHRAGSHADRQIGATKEN